MKIETKSGGGISPTITAIMYIKDGEAVEYQFSRIGYDELRLIRHSSMTKKANQKKWRYFTLWDRYDKRNNVIDESTLPSQDICDAVLNEYCKLIKVVL